MVCGHASNPPPPHCRARPHARDMPLTPAMRSFVHRYATPCRVRLALAAHGDAGASRRGVANRPLGTRIRPPPPRAAAPAEGACTRPGRRILGLRCWGGRAHAGRRVRDRGRRLVCSSARPGLQRACRGPICHFKRARVLMVTAFIADKTLWNPSCTIKKGANAYFWRP
jgi:hypothetical protein